MLSAINKIRPAAIEAERLYRKFHKEAASIQKRLWQATRSNDRLVISVEISEQLKAVGASGSSGQQGHIETIDVTFGRLSGLAAVRPTFDPVKALNNLERQISAYNIGDDEGKIFNFICELDEKDRKFCAGKLQETNNSFQKLHEKLMDFASFFNGDNLQRLNAWGNHPENPTPLYVEDGMFQKQRRITIKYKRPNTDKAVETVLSPKSTLLDLSVDWPIK
jgi:hypothetical protein